MAENKYDVIVVGGGMMGSAAARHLTRAGVSVAVVAPSEPADKPSHAGPFASHYDEARITRKLATDPDWSLLSIRSIERYATLEAETGIGFYKPCGALMAASPRNAAEGIVDRIAAVDRRFDIGAERWRGDEVEAHLPFLAFPNDAAVFYERSGGGYINPRAHVRAQLQAARAGGADIFARPAIGIEETTQDVWVTLEGGEVLQAGKVIVASGAYAGLQGFLPDPAPLKIYARTVVFLEVDDQEAQRLRDMPSLIFYPPDLDHDVYVLPPVRYPDGKIYIKIGGDPTDIMLTSQSEITEWFRTKGTLSLIPYLSDILMQILPGLRVLSRHSAPCMTSFSPSGKPLIYDASDRTVVLTAGNGAGAKNADELGRLGALRARGETLAGEGYRTDFKP